MPLGKFVVSRGLAALNPAPLIGVVPPAAPAAAAPGPGPAPAPAPGPAPNVTAPAPAPAPGPAIPVAKSAEATVPHSTVAPPTSDGSDANRPIPPATRLDTRGASNPFKWAGNSEDTKIAAPDAPAAQGPDWEVIND